MAIYTYPVWLWVVGISLFSVITVCIHIGQDHIRLYTHKHWKSISCAILISGTLWKDNSKKTNNWVSFLLGNNGIIGHSYWAQFQSSSNIIVGKSVHQYMIKYWSGIFPRPYMVVGWYNALPNQNSPGCSHTRMWEHSCSHPNSKITLSLECCSQSRVREN